jgi:hypothetical protein
MLNGFADNKAVTSLTNELKNEFGRNNGNKWRVAYNGADLKSSAGAASLVEDTVKELGGIDIGSSC